MRYEYDALGRRTAKICQSRIYRYLWSGNVLLHEWNYTSDARPQPVLDNLGRLKMAAAEPTENLVTWVYEENTFVPAAKLVGDKRYSIVCDYLGTPIQSYNENGDLVWARELDIYGKTRKEKGETNFIPFHYQGQMYDAEVDLCYNRFRWYDQNTGLYISQDPIGLAGGNPTFYGYVQDVNYEVDIWGLECNRGRIQA